MNRFRRIVLNCIAAACALLWILTCLLWVRSYGLGDNLNVIPSAHRGFAFYSDRGLFIIFRVDGEPLVRATFPTPPPRPPVIPRVQYRRANSTFGTDSARRQWNSVFFWNRPGRIDLGVSIWIVFLATIAPPLLIWRRGLLRRARRRLRKWLFPDLSFCQQCGYDLRATPSRCPECGATPTYQHA